MVTKTQLLALIEEAIEKDQAIILDAGDYSTDYYKIVQERSLKLFKEEITKFASDTTDAGFDPCINVKYKCDDIGLSGEGFVMEYNIFNFALSPVMIKL